MSDSVRYLWVLSLSSSAQVHKSFSDLTNTDTTSSQHVELGVARRTIDFNDCQKFYQWLSTRNPFVVENPNLYSLATGLVSITGTDSVSCDRAEEIGHVIQKSFDGVSLSNCSIPSKSVVRSLSFLANPGKSDKSELISRIDNQVMFVRLTAIADRMDNLESVFDYELTTEPMSLFKDGLMRKPDKPSLLKGLISVNCEVSDYDPNCTLTVVDGGALLHRVR